MVAVPICGIGARPFEGCDTLRRMAHTSLRRLVVDGLEVIGALSEEGCPDGQKMVFGTCREVGADDPPMGKKCGPGERHVGGFCQDVEKDLKPKHQKSAGAAKTSGSQAQAASQKAFGGKDPEAHRKASYLHMNAVTAHLSAGKYAPDEKTAAFHAAKAKEHIGVARQHDAEAEKLR